MNLSFTVYGVPQPQGSTRAFMPKGSRFPVITSANKGLKPWRQDVAVMALSEMKKESAELANGPISLAADFYFERPKSAKRQAQKLTKPDIDKLLRGILDALTGVAYRDDSQVVEVTCVKRFGSPTRAEISVIEITAG